MDYYSIKRRKINESSLQHISMNVDDKNGASIPIFTRATIPSPEITIPLSIISANTPQELVYNILVEDKSFYTKQELLLILNNLQHMLRPTFSGECSYIS